MTAHMVYDLVDPAELTSYVRQWDIEYLRPTSQFALGTFLPDKLVDDLDFRIRKGTLTDVDVAYYRNWDTPPPMTKREGVAYIRGEISPISRGIPLSEEEMLRQRALLTGNTDPLIDAIFADAERMMRSVQARIELARGDVINDGKVTINENGVNLEADFGRDSSMSVTASTLWTNAGSSTPLTNLLNWMETYYDFNGTMPGTVIMPRARVLNLVTNAEMRGYAAINGVTPSRLNLETVQAILQSEGIPPIFVYDSAFRVNGTSTRALPANKIFFMPDANEPLGETFYGVTAEALKLRGKGMITAEQAPGVVCCTYENELPVQSLVAAHAVALPVTPNPSLIMDAVVA